MSVRMAGMVRGNLGGIRRRDGGPCDDKVGLFCPI